MMLSIGELLQAQIAHHTTPTLGQIWLPSLSLGYPRNLSDALNTPLYPMGSFSNARARGIMNWLRKLSMRNKLLLLVLPTLLLMIILPQAMPNHPNRYQEAQTVERFADLAAASAPVITALQRERGLSALTMASGLPVITSNSCDSNARRLAMPSSSLSPVHEK